ncbi:hypothetical protein [Streptomyces apocyni]|uniref:hypothetical protein n=1 Tax=Streptomyces apocyni TaxID=2654677 RepID=UPI0012E9CE7F|nr:hypothetical protein [Streptomyces apocyni]
MRKSLAVTLAAGAAMLTSAGAASVAFAADGPMLDDSGNVAQSYGTKVLEGEGLTTQGFGDTAIKHQTGLINQNGAPLVNVDISCPAPWMGGVIHGTVGNNYAACNTDDVSQVKTGSLIG